MDLRFVEIGQDGRPAEPLPLPDVAASACEQTGALYLKNGFLRPWIGYLAVEEGRVVGTCAFVSPPRQGLVEIGYFTFPGDEGRGVATLMARGLLRFAEGADPGVRVMARTLPQKNASTAILRKLGFDLVGTVHVAEDGDVWEWHMPDRGPEGGPGALLE